MIFPICTYNHSSIKDDCMCYDCDRRREMGKPTPHNLPLPPPTSRSTFADYPTSVTEHRTKNSDNAADWTPRDAAISFLRRLDEGEFEGCDTVVIFATYPGKGERGAIMTHYSCASPSMQHTLGAIELGRLRMHKDGEGN